MNGAGRVGSELKGSSTKPDEVHILLRRAQELQVQLAFVMETEDKNTVFWIERRGGRQRMDSSCAERSMCSCKPRPLMFRRSCSKRFSTKLDTAMLTSATLAVGGGFEYMRSGSAWSARASWWCPRTSTTRRRRCSTFRRTCRIRAPHFAAKPRTHPPPAGNHARDAPSAYSPATPRCTTSTTACWASWHIRCCCRDGAEKRAAGRIPHHAECGAVRHRVLLAGCGRAGRAIELRDHRPAAVRGAQRSRGGGAHTGH